MYEAFYGLKERPFELVPNPRFLFLTPRQREALSNLQYGLTMPRGLTLLIGEAGTGKTTLVQAALADPSAAVVKVVLMSNPTLTRSVRTAVAKWKFRPAEVGGCKVPRNFNGEWVTGPPPAKAGQD